ncbi:acyltransferase [Seonamhaeicola algicola]|uniref:Acyltransferase n=1 Tax=Seonamhaeicola algicola TaxID=1719036 RepID=A0A5C7AUF9_9FLAO|nr:acyltransferase [Seonamhaeicola algicola]TXE12031.1 acyltransferase [Seonamhaeicola algicola]
MKKKRIEILDGFRAIAIIMVMCFHFFSRWANIYPYADSYDYFWFGRLGVHFFFIISGFVIFYSLNNTTSFKVFWKNRLIRLLPSMVIATLITFIFVLFFDTEKIFPHAHLVKNVFASITFVQPELLSTLCDRKIEFDYINGSYWSLWHEIQFYFFISFMYFFFQNKFMKVFFVTSVFLTFFWFYISLLDSTEIFFLKKLKSIFELFNLIKSLPLFSYGVFYYLLYKGEFKKYILICVLVMFFLQCSLFWYDKARVISMFIGHILFLLLICRSRYLNWLKNPLLIKIGGASYFLYLIHEVIGVVLITKYGDLEHYALLFVLFLMICFVCVSVFYTQKVEIRIGKYLKKKMS